MNDLVYKTVTWLDSLSKRQILLGLAIVVGVVALLGGGYYLGTQDIGQQQEAPTIQDSQDAENTTEDVTQDLQNVSQELEDVESLF